MSKDKLTQTTSIIIVLLIISNIFSIYRTCVLDSRIEALGKNYQDHLNTNYEPSQYLKLQQFKEDSYIREQQRDKELLLLIIPALLGVFAFFNYSAAERKFQNYSIEVNNKIAEQEKRNIDSQKFLEETRANFNFETYLSRMQESERAIGDNKSLSILLHLSGLTYLVGFYTYQKKHEAQYAQATLTTIQEKLEELYLRFNNKQVLIEGIEKTNIDGCFKGLSDLNNSKINDLIWRLQATFKYPD